MNAPTDRPAEPGQVALERPSLAIALLPVIVLVAMLASAVFLFGEDASYGPNQIALLLCAALASVLGVRHGHSWESLQEGIVEAIRLALPAMLILLLVGALIGSWILAGTVPYLISAGTQLISPAWFYPAACLVCAIVALAIGSSWTTAGTVGVALIGTAQVLDMSLSVTAGAIISGAYFGDRLSPLSDTTNLAAAVSQVDLFDHIRNMLWNTLPAMVLTLMAFALIGGGSPAATETARETLSDAIATEFDLSAWLLLPLAALFLFSAMRLPALPVLTVGILLAAILAMLLQPGNASALAPEGTEGVVAVMAGVWVALFDGYQSQAVDAAASSLLDRGGMSSMLNTVWLILCAMTFGGVMERSGLLSRLVDGLLRLAAGTTSLILSTLATAISSNILTADQYMSIVVPGRLYAAAYRARRMSRLNLSRALEDGGTLSSVMVPWNTCGAFMAATLGVATLSYLPFVFFNLIAIAIGVLSPMLRPAAILMESDRGD